ncbi:hypothetical protein F0562_017096 [Nyssa sinensis]|uniref:Uncharacterized protein n=1 Tax=Nyssa sinensis TaxID=561372 RepID=A0A5J4ZG35_9ASTE|nr:hypothetical protein F0562_017096 [Nyssa sinensis]
MDSLHRSRPNHLLRRRNSIATSVVVPAKLSLPAKPHHTTSFPNGTTTATSTTSLSSSSSLQSFPSVDFKLISIQPLSYTSLKDLLPSTAVESPKPTTPVGHSGCEISIRNRLVKQAAWAYLQPMAASPVADGRHFLHRLWAKLTDNCPMNPFTTFLRFIDQHVIRIMIREFDRLLRAIRVRSSRQRS